MYRYGVVVNRMYRTFSSQLPGNVYNSQLVFYTPSSLQIDFFPRPHHHVNTILHYFMISCAPTSALDARFQQCQAALTGPRKQLQHLFVPVKIHRCHFFHWETDLALSLLLYKLFKHNSTSSVDTKREVFFPLQRGT